MGHESLSSPRTKLLFACPLCRSQDIKHFFSTPDRLIGVPGEFRYSRCGTCESVFQNPMVVREDLHLCYPPQYQAYDYDPELPEFSIDSESGGRRLRDRLRTAVVKKVWNERSEGGLTSVAGRFLALSREARERAFFGLLPDACLPPARDREYALEIGCGAGWFLKRLRKVGWLAEGVEWDETAAQRAAERSGCEVRTGDYRKLALTEGKYSLVVLNHVFEHLDDPIESLKRFRTLLKPGGRVVLVYPNPNSVDAGWYGDNWYAWEAPRHLILPSAKAIRDAALSTGYTLADVLTRVEITQWTSSKAYQQGLHPEKVRPALQFSERAAVGVQWLIARLGIKKGSEIVAVLQAA